MMMTTHIRVRSGDSKRWTAKEYLRLTKFGFFAPKGTPDAIMQKWIAAVPEAMKSPEFVEATKRSFNSTMYLNPAQFKVVLDNEDKYFKKLITDLKLGGQQ